MNKLSVNEEIFREYDIRGVVGKDFDEKFSHALGQTLATYIIKKTGNAHPILTVGYDARLSSPSLATAMCEGMQSTGAHVVTLGLVTTPISYFSMFHIPNAAGGVMITGSHNPPEYNGFKVSVGKTTIYGEEIQELRKLMESGEFAKGRGEISKKDIFDEYVARYREEFKGLENTKVVIDCGNGSAGCIARRLYEGVGTEADHSF